MCNSGRRPERVHCEWQWTGYLLRMPRWTSAIISAIKCACPKFRREPCTQRAGELEAGFDYRIRPAIYDPAFYYHRCEWYRIKYPVRPVWIQLKHFSDLSAVPGHGKHGEQLCELLRDCGPCGHYLDVHSECDSCFSGE